MHTDLRRSVAALTAAGLLWGTTVPLSKVALEWLPPAWLTFARFSVAAVILLVVARGRLRAACTPAVLAWGAVGYGGTVLVQNAGIGRTSVSHAALLIGAAPVLVAIVAAIWRRTVARPVAWAGFLGSLAGVGLIAGGPSAGASISGDGLVLVSLLISATFTVAQAGLLRGRDPVAVTAVQFLASAAAVLPVATVSEGMPARPGSAGTFLAFAGLALGGTVLPFALFAYGQVRVSAEVAGAFLNLEPLIGAVAGAVVFRNPVDARQLIGGAVILAGIGLSSLPLLAVQRRPVSQPRPGGRLRNGPVQRGRENTFEGQQPALDFDASAAAVAAQPVRSHHPMARHDDRYRIGSHDLADGPGGHRYPGIDVGQAGQHAVADGLAEAHRIVEHSEHLTLQPGPGRPIKRQLEGAALTGEVLGELPPGGRRQLGRCRAGGGSRAGFCRAGGGSRAGFCRAGRGSRAGRCLTGGGLAGGGRQPEPDGGNAGIAAGYRDLPNRRSECGPDAFDHEPILAQSAGAGLSVAGGTYRLPSHRPEGEDHGEERRGCDRGRARRPFPAVNRASGA
jgi:O-acetylserine/cysteine efflux transporter